MPRKNVSSDKWSTQVLEQVAAACNAPSTARTTQDWNLYLEAISDALGVLTEKQRVILLLSQEFGISFVDIGRVFKMPNSTVIATLDAAIERVAAFLKARSLASKNLFACKLFQKIYNGHIHVEELNHEPQNVDITDRVQPIWFYSRNYLWLSTESEESQDN